MKTNEWQPIATAPEMKWILCVDSCGIVMVRKTDGLFRDVNEVVMTAFTHWMPLPEPPK
jgi:hypothetical protein